MATNNALNNMATSLKIVTTTGTYGVSMDSFITPIDTGNGSDIKIYSPVSNVISSSNATDTRSIKIGVSNTKNDVGSTGSLIVKVTDTDTSNAYYQLSNTTTTWTLGSAPIDASNTKFVLSPSATFNTGNVMEVKESGEVNFPLNCAFSAFLSSTASNVTGNNTTYTILCDSEVFDVGGNYDTGTGTFTAPVTGKYHFIYSILLGGIVNANDNTSTLVTSNRVYKSNANSATAVKDAAGQASYRGEFLCDLDAGDTATATVYSTGEGSNVNDVIGHASALYTFFQGRLVC